MARSTKGASKGSQLRIIGGQWRGRKLAFTPGPGLRPTTDRVRETLFNWLAPQLHDARCADLFAGSGVLGLEALSRGAASCDFVDSSGAALREIDQHLATLGARGRGQCHSQFALQFLQGAPEPYDIVFIDPPFGSDLAETACAQLGELQLLREDARVYVEAGANETPPQTPSDWRLHREKQAGGVVYRLFIVDPGQIV
jgi:16S rRNA (guanine966-N2)-methyltransferase